MNAFGLAVRCVLLAAPHYIMAAWLSPTQFCYRDRCVEGPFATSGCVHDVWMGIVTDRAELSLLGIALSVTLTFPAARWLMSVRQPRRFAAWVLVGLANALVWQGFVILNSGGRFIGGWPCRPLRGAYVQIVSFEHWTNDTTISVLFALLLSILTVPLLMSRVRKTPGKE